MRSPPASTSSSNSAPRPSGRTPQNWPRPASSRGGVSHFVVIDRSQVLRVCPCHRGRTGPPFWSCSTSQKEVIQCLTRNRRFRRVLESPSARSSLWPDRSLLPLEGERPLRIPTKSGRVAPTGGPSFVCPPMVTVGCAASARAPATALGRGANRQAGGPPWLQDAHES